MTWLTRWIIDSLLGRYLMLGLAVLAGLTFKRMQDERRGVLAERAKADLRNAKAYRETRERMDDAQTSFGVDPDIIRDSLRTRDPNKR
jgi:hypothetical protein